MIHELLTTFLLVFSVAGSLFLWFAYKRQYRFATLLFDMLPLYPMIIIMGFMTSIGSDGYLSLTFSELFYWLLPLLVVNFSVQFILFWQWFSLYRFKNYTKFLQNFKNSPNLRVISLKEWFAKPKKDPNHILVLIRHDVDINLNRARRMINEERKICIPSCYYFRNNAERYTLEEAAVLIKELTSLELFDVGFHYETIDNTDGNIKKAINLFPKEVEQFREIYPIRIIAAHGSKYNNNRLVSEKLVDIESLGLISAYQLPHDHYLSDAMGLHHFDSKHARANQAKHFLDSLKILDQLPKGTLVQILIHPDWWF